jgi:uncharacterized protein YkwD
MRTVAMALAVLMSLTAASCAQLQAQTREEPAPRPMPPVETPSSKSPAPVPVAAKLLELHNRERAEAKKSPLALNEKLTAAAGVHARDMAEHGKMAHEGSDGSKPAQRIERQGYHYRRAGENVAYGQPTPGRVMQGWMNSPHHRENILGDYSEMGAARVEDEDGTPYWCVTFGLPWPRRDPVRASSTLIEEINKRRAEAELPPLEADATLADAALRLARAMAGHGKFVKTDDDGLTPFQRVEQAGGHFRKLAEGAADGQPDAEAAVKTLMDDKGLKANVLGDFSHVGVGYARGEDERPYWCLLFGLSGSR